MFNVRKRKYGSARGGSRKKPRFTFRRGRPTWGSMYKATKKSTWARKSKKRTRKVIGGNRMSSTVFGRRKAGTLAYKIGRAIAATSQQRTTCAKRISTIFNSQSSYAFGYLQGRPTTLNGSTIYELFNSHGFAGGGSFRAQNINIDYVVCEYEVTNMCNAVVTVTIRDLVCKQDVNKSGTFEPTAKWNEALADVLASNVWNANTPGAVPGDGFDFGRFFNTVRTTKMVLNPGQIHKHRVVRRLNRSVKLGQIYQAAGNNDNDLVNVRGITGYAMFTVHGQPCTDVENSEAIVLSPANIGIYGTQKIVHHWVADNTTQNYPLSNGFDGPASTVINPSLVNDDMGVVESYTSA